jgi:hypothetical protein
LFALWGFEYEYCLQELWLYLYTRGAGWEGTYQHSEEKMLLKRDTGFLSARGARLFIRLCSTMVVVLRGPMPMGGERK